MRPQRLVLGLVFILWVTSGMEGCSEIPRFAEDPQPLQVVGYLTEGEEIQRDLAEMSKWTSSWQMTFRAGKCDIPCTHREKLFVSGQYDVEPGTAQEGVQHHRQQFSEIISSVCNGS